MTTSRLDMSDLAGPTAPGRPAADGDSAVAPDVHVAPDDPIPTIDDVIRDHHVAVFRYAYRLCGSATDAEDLSQQTFLIAHQRLDQLREPGKVTSWLFAIVRSVYLKQRRRRKPVDAGSLELDMGEIPSAADATSPIDRQALQIAIDELPDEFKIVLVLFYFEERSYKEIADELNLKIGTVMSRLARAKERLRWRLARLAEEIGAGPRSIESSERTMGRTDSEPAATGRRDSP